MISTVTRPVFGRTIVAALLLLLAMGGIAPESVMHAQTSITRDVISGGGGTITSSGHRVRGTLSQTAIGRLARGAGDRHDVGFWYRAYRPEVVARVWIPLLEAEVGTRLTVPVHLSISETRGAFLPRPFRARIRFNHTLLHPAGSTPQCTYEADDCVIDITGIAQADGVIAELEFIVALGNAESTPLTIEEFEWETNGEQRVATIREHGELRLLGVCREGGQIRLINSGPLASRLRIWPNPIAERATLEFISSEAGPVEIRLVDLFGNDIVRMVQTDVEPQRLYREEVDLGTVSSGSYVIVYSTPSRTLTQRVIIMQ